MIRRLLQHVTKRDLIVAAAAARLAGSFAIPGFNGSVERGRSIARTTAQMLHRHAATKAPAAAGPTASATSFGLARSQTS